MKTAFLFLLASFFIFNGCKENSSIISADDFPEKANPVEIPSASEGSQVESYVNFSQTISGDKGGQIDFEHSFPGLLGAVKVKGKLVIPANAYYGKKQITIQLNDKYAYVDFGPSPVSFELPLLFDIEYSNMNLLSFIEGLLDFGFISPDNNFYGCQYDELYISILKRKLAVKGARLKHFSRYGFTKRSFDR